MAIATIIWNPLNDSLKEEELKTIHGYVIPRAVMSIINIGVVSRWLEHQTGITTDYQEHMKYLAYLPSKVFIGQFGSLYHTPVIENRMKSKPGQIGVLRLVPFDVSSIYDTSSSSPSADFYAQLELSDKRKIPRSYLQSPLDYVRHLATTLVPLFGQPSQLLDKTENIEGVSIKI